MDLLLLPAPTAWDTVPSGLTASGDTLATDNTEASDLFDDASLDPALWGTFLDNGTGAASITEAGGKALVKTTTVDAAAILYYAETLQPRATKRWRLRWKQKLTVGDMIVCALLQEVGTPQAGGINAKTIGEISISSAGEVAVSYNNTAGTRMYWGPTGWSAVAAYVAMGGGFNTELIFEGENDLSNLIFRIFNADESECLLTATVPWADVKVEANNLYFYCGDPFAAVYYGDLDVYEFWHYGSYPASIVATMGEIPMYGATIEQVPITETVESGAAISYRYNLNRSGWSTVKTLAQMQADLVGQACSYLDIEATYTSDGAAQTTLDINGGALGGRKYSVPTDSGDSIRQQILDVLTTRFATILIANGYKTNLGNNITHWRASTADVGKAKLPHLGWEDADEDDLDVTIGQVDHILSITCKISVKAEADITKARSDLIKMLGTDVFMSGLAGNTTPPVEQGDVFQGTDKIWTQEYKFVIEYPTDRFDDFNQ